MPKAKIGFIGIDIRINPIVKSLIKANYPVIIYSPCEQSLSEITIEGAEKGASYAQVARDCDIIITMLDSTSEIEEAVLGKDGILQGSCQGQIFIEMSSLNSSTSQLLSRELEKQGIDMLQVVFGAEGEKGHAKGISISVKGKEEIFNYCKPILDMVGKPILEGDIGREEQ